MTIERWSSYLLCDNNSTTALQMNLSNRLKEEEELREKNRQAHRKRAEQERQERQSRMQKQHKSQHQSQPQKPATILISTKTSRPMKRPEIRDIALTVPIKHYEIDEDKPMYGEIAKLIEVKEHNAVATATNRTETPVTFLNLGTKAPTPGAATTKRKGGSKRKSRKRRVRRRTTRRRTIRRRTIRRRSIHNRRKSRKRTNRIVRKNLRKTKK